MKTATEVTAEARARKNAARRDALIEEIEFLVRCGVGEAAILSALGYTNKPLALQQRLGRAKRRDLIPLIFEWQAECELRMHPNKAAA